MNVHVKKCFLLTNSYFSLLYTIRHSRHTHGPGYYFYFTERPLRPFPQYSSSYGTNYHSPTHNKKKRAKQQVMKAIAVQTGHEIPNKDIATIQTLKDIHSTLFSLSSASKDASENPKGHVVAEWFQKNQSSLPPNMTFIPYAKAKGVKAEDRKRTNKRYL